MRYGLTLLVVLAGMGSTSAQNQILSVKTPSPSFCPVLTRDGSTVFWSLPSKIFRLDAGDKEPTAVGATGVFLDVSPDGQFLGTSKGEIWDLKAKKNIKTLDMRFSPVTFSDDGKLFIGSVANDSGGVAYCLFDVPSFAKKLVVDFERPNAVLTRIVNGRFAVSSGDGRVAVFDTAGKVIYREKIHDGAIIGLALVDKSRKLVSRTQGSQLSLLDVDTKKQEFFEPHDGDYIESLAASMDGKRIATSGGGEIKIWESSGMKLAMTIPIKGEFINGLAFSGDGKKLAVATGNTTLSSEGKIIIFDVKGK